LIRWWRSAMNDQKEELPLSIVSPSNVGHYVWGDSCDGWHLVLHSDLSVIEECVPAGASEVRHYHQKALCSGIFDVASVRNKFEMLHVSS
jgi:hypothetical protein